jgi:hypothetical protein
MVIFASFSTSFMPPALPAAGMEKAGAAAAPAAGAADGAAAAGVFGLSLSCIFPAIKTPSSLQNAVSLQSLDDLHELAFGQGKLGLDGIDIDVSAGLLDKGDDLPL